MLITSRLLIVLDCMSSGLILCGVLVCVKNALLVVWGVGEDGLGVGWLAGGFSEQ